MLYQKEEEEVEEEAVSHIHIEHLFSPDTYTDLMLYKTFPFFILYSKSFSIFALCVICYTYVHVAWWLIQYLYTKNIRVYCTDSFQLYFVNNLNIFLFFYFLLILNIKNLYVCIVWDQGNHQTAPLALYISRERQQPINPFIFGTAVYNVLNPNNPWNNRFYGAPHLNNFYLPVAPPPMLPAGYVYPRPSIPFSM